MMKPVAIFRHAPTEGPGYLATFLDSREIPWRLIRIDAGDPLPGHWGDFSGLVFMGGPMSVNDDLPWIPPVLALIRGAVKDSIPVLGHCLGGQLMSKALGGQVTRNPVKEIGWGTLHTLPSTESTRWFGAESCFVGFHWHGETFSLPLGAVRVLSSAYCDNQAFALGPHLGFQCHVEMTTEMVREWCAIGATEIEGAVSSPGVQPVETILQDMEPKVATLNKIAEKIYAEWIKNLVP